MTGPFRQLAALVRLRVTMIRPARRRLVVLTVLAAFPAGALWFIQLGRALPQVYVEDVRLILPTLLAAYAVLALVTPLSAGGGLELVPADQVTPYPIRSSTQYLMALLLTPLNIAWLAQTFLVLGAVSYATAGTRAATSSLVGAVLWIVWCTTAGLFGSWLLIGIRQSTVGRIATWVAGGLLAAGAFTLVQTGRLVAFLDELPTVGVAARLLLIPGPQYYRFLGYLLAAIVATVLAGLAACSWTLRRPGQRFASPESRPRRRPRDGTAHPLRQLVRKDRVAVWRSPALRRGILVIAILPALVSLLATMSWTGLVLLPGLVAAGAALLFGVNAFCLDGQGAVWLATLPNEPRLLLLSKAVIVTETCLGAALVALTAGSLSTGRLPSAAEFATVVTAVVTTVVVVVTRSLRLSVFRPHRADLRGLRDTPAPPGTMALYSADLAARTSLLAMWLLPAVLTGLWWAAPVMAAPVLLACAGSLSGTWRAWTDPVTRAGVLSTVAYG